MPPRRTTTKGFKRTNSLLSQQIRKASETRGFAQSRLLTHWAEIAGEATAAISRPVEVSYGRKEGIGATLTLLTTGANAPVGNAERATARAGQRGLWLQRHRASADPQTAATEAKGASLSITSPRAAPPQPRVAAKSSRGRQALADEAAQGPASGEHIEQEPKLTI